MKKLIFVFILAAFLPLSAHPFWILSAKSKTLSGSHSQVGNDPSIKLMQAVKEFDKKNYTKAYVVCRWIVKKFPDAVEASEALYYMGRAQEELRNPYEAYLSYQRILDSYPNSKRINEVIEREYTIGATLAGKRASQFLGLTKYDFNEHPSIAIFKNLSEKVPGSKYASKAQYQLGMLFISLKRYDEAKETFARLIDKYPDSEWYAPAKYQLAQATAKGFGGTEYDTTAVQDATKRLDEFLSSHPNITSGTVNIRPPGFIMKWCWINIRVRLAPIKPKLL